MQDEPPAEAPAQPQTPTAVRVVLFAIAICGLLIIGLSFAPWVQFENIGDNPGDYVSFSIPGTQIGRVVGDDYNQPADVADQRTNPCSCRGDAGDGYITALLGAFVIAGAGAALFWSGLTRWATLLVAFSSLGALVVAGWNAMTTWRAVGAPDLQSTFVELSGDVTPQLHALTALSALTAILCGVVWALSTSAAPAEDELTDEETLPEGANGWA